ncbi:indolepyruvate ferredoxin oxidoreductase subunit alpha [Pelotomaculum propionicicum]|uniref:indolepyruvate ferredoxin oxidoreductase subunit alpha n=1 Tax=Pelotomaculum propionicicum TaxID=258475 RepID=UPI003B7C487E
MGNEAIAYGAVEAGVQVAAAYPGTPSSEILGTLSSMAGEHGFYAEWSVNEKAALETAAGASIAGARSLAAMKQVGLNVASDPLMSLAYIGVKGGLVLVVADDPGPHSSQTEQDTRKFAQFAKLPVLDPSNPAEAREMIKYAFELSEKLLLPVILRPTTRTCHACQDVELPDNIREPLPPAGFTKSNDWVIFPSLSARKHVWLNKQQEAARDILGSSTFNSLEIDNNSTVGIVACGLSYNYVREALKLTGLKASVLKIGTPYPLPAGPVLELFKHAERVLVIEEQEPVVEDQVISLAWQHRLESRISGKHDRLVPREGEFNVDKIKAIIEKYFGREAAPAEDETIPALPLRTPILCAGCPHRASFYIFKEAARGTDAVFTGDIGCYTLGAIPPLNAVDTCLCMGASITMAAGLHRAEPGRRHVAFLGDSTFFHSGVTGLINAVYNRADITVVILDNRTTAMTGHQTHPGMGKTAMAEEAARVDIASLVKACGVDFVREVDPFDLAAAGEAAKAAMDHSGTSVVIMRRDCAALVKKEQPYSISSDDCVNCGACVEDLGCPAIGRRDGLPVINSNCAGCGVCSRICPAKAIRR